MGKFYVYIEINASKYKLCKDDIKNIYSLRKAKLPELPTFSAHSEK